MLQEVQRFRSEVTIRRGQLKNAQANQESGSPRGPPPSARSRRGSRSGRSSCRRFAVRSRGSRPRRPAARRSLARQAALRLSSQEAAEQHAIDTSVIGAGAETPQAGDRASFPLRRRRRDRDAVPRHPVPLGRRVADERLRLLRVRDVCLYAQVGLLPLPHHAASQYSYGVPVSRDQLAPGDLVLFNGLGHMGIDIGGGQFVHAPHTGDVVKISSRSIG